MENKNFIFGRNVVKEAILANREIEYILISNNKNMGSINEIIKLAMDRKIIIKEGFNKKLDEISKNLSHQGIAALVSAHKYYTVDDILKTAKNKSEAPFIIIADGIEDPHNLGAIIRTAECCGAHGIIIPKRNSVGLTAIVEKTSAGALEYIKVAKVTNISNTIDYLKENGIWVYCADMNGQPYFNENLTGGVALVIGSEGHGVSKLVKQKCDVTLSIPLKGNITSLNASVAAGVLMCKVLESRLK